MRWMGMLSSILTLVAVFVGISSLTAFGFGGWEIVKILVPVGIAVALFALLVFYFGKWSARWLNRDEGDDG